MHTAFSPSTVLAAGDQAVKQTSSPAQTPYFHGRRGKMARITSVSSFRACWSPKLSVAPHPMVGLKAVAYCSSFPQGPGSHHGLSQTPAKALLLHPWAPRPGSLTSALLCTEGPRNSSLAYKGTRRQNRDANCRLGPRNQA